MNKRQQKKIAKQQILSSLQSKGLTKRQARNEYATSFAHKETSSLTQIAKRSSSATTKVKDFYNKLKQIRFKDKKINVQLMKNYLCDNNDVDVNSHCLKFCRSLRQQDIDGPST